MIQKNWTELIKANKKIDGGHDAKRFATVVAEPLERGFGLTLGNALRRILLSSLQGAAVSSVRIEGVLHEFSSIPGVVEDVTDIILNIKSLVVKSTSEQPKVIRIDRHERGVVKAAHITTDETVQIINPEHPILKDLRVRQAINMSINRKAIIDALYPEVGEPLNGMMVRKTSLGWRCCRNSCAAAWLR